MRSLSLGSCQIGNTCVPASDAKRIQLISPVIRIDKARMVKGISSCTGLSGLPAGVVSTPLTEVRSGHVIETPVRNGHILPKAKSRHRRDVSPFEDAIMAFASPDAPIYSDVTRKTWGRR